MKYATIVHGTPDYKEYFSSEYPSQSNSHWLPWLQKQLLMHGWLAQTPEMPNAWRPNYEEWRAIFERLPIGPDTLLIGHSCGAGFLLRWMSETDITIGKLIMVAPWIDPTGHKDPAFFNFTINPGLTARAQVHVVTSDNDDGDVLSSVEQICTALPAAKRHDFPGYGHFCTSNLGGPEFPELRDIALAVR